MQKIANVIVLILVTSAVAWPQLLVKNSSHTVLMKVTSDGNVGIGIDAVDPQARTEIFGGGDVQNVIAITGAFLSHRFGLYSHNNFNSTGSLDPKGNFAIMGAAYSPNSTIDGYFNAGVAGRVYDHTGTVLLAQGELGKSQTAGGRWVHSVMGNLNAGQVAGYIGSGGFSAAVRANVMNNASEHERVWAGYFEGAKSYFSHTVTMPGADYAEWFEKEGETSPGDLIGINEQTGKARRYQAGDILIGVHSGNPAILGNHAGENIDQTHVMVALLGQVDINRAQIKTDGRKVFSFDGKFVGILLASDRIYIHGRFE